MAANICIVVPTIREDQLKKFKAAWADLFAKHDVELIVVHDGERDKVYLEHDTPTRLSIKDVMGKDEDLIFNKTAAVRNLGFAYVAKELTEATTIITLDDDVTPGYRDPIWEHMAAMIYNRPISWINTMDNRYARGFPYAIREEAPVKVSHGFWEGVHDFDAPTQLMLAPNNLGDDTQYQGVIPKGVYYPMSSMNLAFHRDALPFMYMAPSGERTPGIDRFDDIWCGIYSKRELDKRNWAVVTGYSTVQHDRASNVFKNLQKEAKGLEWNEEVWKKDPKDPYFTEYAKLRKRWEKFCS